MLFLNLSFCLEKLDFSRIALTLKRFYGFCRVGADFGGPLNQSKSKKVSFGSSKKGCSEQNMKNHDLSKPMRKARPQFGPNVWAFLTFSRNQSMKQTENHNQLGSQQSCFLFILTSFWEAKSHPK